MKKPSKKWEIKEVVLVPKYIDQEQHDQLLTELAQILYDYSCQFRKVSLTAPAEKQPRGLPKKEAFDE